MNSTHIVTSPVLPGVFYLSRFGMRYANKKWYIDQMTVPAMLNRNVVRFCDRTSQMWKDEQGKMHSLTWGQTGGIVKELCAGLMRKGFKKGDRAAIMCNTSPQWMWCDYAILCAGGITVCIYPMLSEMEIEYILKDSGTTVVFVENSEILTRVQNAIAKGESAVTQIVVMSDHFESADTMVTDLSRMRNEGVSLLVKDRFAFDRQWRSVELYDYMTIVYTSGTTGMPKGAVQTHFSYSAACCRDVTFMNEAKDDDIMMSFLPLSHTYERQCGQGTVLITGMPVAYSSPKTLVEDLKIFKPTYIMSVPRIYERIFIAMRDGAAKSPVKKAIFDAALKTGLQVINARSDKNGFIDMSEGISLTKGVSPWLALKFRIFDALIFKKVREALGGRLRCAVSAAGSLSPDLCKTFLAMGVRILEGYGATETWNDVNVNRLNKLLPGSVGPLSISAIQGRIAEDGEWLVKGDTIFSGYWNNPEATKEAFTEDGFYKTGDIVEMVADGYIKIVDRKKGLMVLDTGKNVASARIESMFALSRFIDMVVPIGSERKYVTAIIIPNFDACIEHFKEKGIAFDRNALKYSYDAAAPVCINVGKDFVENDVFKAIIEEEVAKVNKELESYEKIKKYMTLDRKFTVETGELTPTLKVKRRIVLDMYKNEIDTMYT